MAINTGVNVSKLVALAPITLPAGVTVSKLVGFAVMVAVNGNAPVWSTFTMADGYVIIPYYQEWDLTPAASPTTYSVVSGSLPTGLSLSDISGDRGKIDGTPTVIGVYSFTLRATNLYGTADQAFTITISAPPATGGSYTFVM